MFASAIITKTPVESRAINEVPGPEIIISASGMATGGRVLHHLTHYISDSKNVIVMVGYQAIGTRGRALLEGASEIKIFKVDFSRFQQKLKISGLSAHADSRELIKWLKNSPIKHPKVFLTHGEPASAHELTIKIHNTLNWQVEIPKDGEEYRL